MVHDDRFDEIVSGLRKIREGLETFHASAPSPNNEEDRREPEDLDTMALEEYLASHLQQMGEVAAETKEITGLKTGNGWDAAQIVEQVYRIDPVSMKRAVDVAISSNRKLKERVANKLMRRRSDTRLVGTPTIEFVPIWKIRGFHECYYLRSNAYKVKVKEDVVGVEVEGKSRDLILERRHRSFVPSLLLERLQKLGAFLSGESKYFVVSEVVELARCRSDGELVMTGAGKEMSQDDELTLTSWRSKRIFDQTELKVKGATIRIRDPAVSKENFLAKFREEVIRMPERFKQILSNRLQVTELKKVYVPLIRIPIQKGLVPREVVVNGTSGELADNTLLALFE